MDIIERTKLYDGNHLCIREAVYRDSLGRVQRWQYAERSGVPAVVTVIATSRATGSILLIRQQRIPIEAEQIEFPAGLVDDGETLEAAALRELREETGVSAVVSSVSPLLSKSAGMSNEKTAFVFCVADETSVGEPEPDEQEFITSFWVHPSDFFSYVKSQPNVGVAADVYAYFAGRADGVGGR